MTRRQNEGASKTGKKRTPPHERVLAHAMPDANGCLISHLVPRESGHVYVSVYGKKNLFSPAYREVYIALKGPIPDDWDVHHICENPPCVNISHLEALSKPDHRARHVQTRTRCRSGKHPWVPPFYMGNGKPHCRLCILERMARDRARKAASPDPS